MRILLSPDQVENQPAGTAGSPAAPQAAETVVNGKTTEELAREKKKLETEIAELQDRKHTIQKTPQAPAPETPADEAEEEHHDGWAFPGEG